MAFLKCPSCGTVVEAHPGTLARCAGCGFTAPVPGAPVRAGTPVTVLPQVMAPAGNAIPSPPAAMASAPNSPFPFSIPTTSPLGVSASFAKPGASTSKPAKRRTGLWVTVGIVALLVVSASAVAALYATQPELLGFKKKQPPLVTEEQLKQALAKFDAAVEQGADERWGATGTFNLKEDPSAPEGFSLTGSGTIRLLQDPQAQAQETHFTLSSGAVTFDYTIKQKGKVLNSYLGSDGFYARDEDPSTQPNVGELSGDGSDSPASTPFKIPDTVGIDSREATTYKGKAATRFFAHNMSKPDEHYEFIVYNADQRLAYLKSNANEGTLEMEMLYGDEVSISVSTELPRTSFTLKSDGFACTSTEACHVSSEHTEEVAVTEVEMRANSFGSSEDASPPKMRLDERDKTVGNYTFHFGDQDGNGLVSRGDEYWMDVSGDDSALIGFFDLWANKAEGGPQTPGFEGSLLGVAVLLAGAAWRRRRQEP